MTTTPPEAPSGQPADHGGPDQGPRVTREEVRNLGRLRRSSHDRKIAGVAGGLGRHLDIDPMILRVAFVVLAFFGGAGLIIYGACWLLVPEDGAAEATVRLDERSRTVALLVVGGIAVLALLGDSLGGFGFPWPLAIIGLVVLLILVNRERNTPPRPQPTFAPPTGPAPGAPYGQPGQPVGQAYAAPAAGHPTATYPTATYPTGGHPTAPYAAGYPAATYPPAYAPVPPRPRNPRRRGPILFWFTCALIALSVGVLGIVDLAGAPVADAAYPALALGITGAMLLVGAFYGRAGGLIALGLVAALATAGAAAADEVDGGRIDDTPRTAAQVDDTYDLFAGEIVLDLTQVQDLEALDGRDIQLEATFGRIEVLLPEGLDVEVDANVEGGGQTTLFGRQTDGTSSRFHDGGVDAPVLVIDATVTFGEIDVDTTGRSVR